MQIVFLDKTVQPGLVPGALFSQEFLARKHKNLYIGMSGMLGPLYYAPVKLAQMVGSIMNMMLGSEKILFGTDWPAAPADLQVKSILDLTISEELQTGWGYPPITDQDRANMLGINLAKLLNVEVPEKYRQWVK